MIYWKFFRTCKYINNTVFANLGIYRDGLTDLLQNDLRFPCILSCTIAGKSGKPLKIEISFTGIPEIGGGA